jgi:hypothetical protein
MSNLKVEVVPLETLTPDPSNVRLHGEKNLKAIIGSLKKFGQQKPIVVDKNDVIIAGNGTFFAAKELKWKEINIIRTKLSKAEAAAFAIADNRSAELASWDYEGLGGILKGLAEDGFDLGELGWEEDDLDNILNANWVPPTDDGSDPYVMMDSIKVTQEQHAVIDKAVEKCRGQLNQPDASEGRCLELICGDYLSGA